MGPCSSTSSVDTSGRHTFQRAFDPECTSGTPWWKNRCITDALRSLAISGGVDLLAAIPGLKFAESAPEVIAKLPGMINRFAGHQLGQVGAVADQQGERALTGIAAVGGATYATKGISEGDAFAWGTLGLSLASLLPGASGIAAAAQGALDVAKFLDTIAKCPR